MKKIKGIYAAGMSVFNDDLSLNICKDNKSCRKNNRSRLSWCCYFWKHWASTTYIYK